MVPQGKRKRGRPKVGHRDGIKENMMVTDVREKDALNRTRWRQKICVKPEGE